MGSNTNVQLFQTALGSNSSFHKSCYQFLGKQFLTKRVRN